jgi:hypothetical protein
LVTFHESVALPPVFIDVGDTEIAITGVARTVRTAEALPEPALLLHVIVYVLLPAAPIAPVLVLPLADLLPVQLPLAVHDVGLFVELQLIVAALPVPIVVGLTEIEVTGLSTVGWLGLTDIEELPIAVPPGLVHDSV